MTSGTLLFPHSVSAQSAREKKSEKWDLWGGVRPHAVIQKETEEITNNDLQNAIRAGRKQYVDTRAEIVRLLIEVNQASITAEEFYQKVSQLDMPPNKEIRHTLMEVKKDIGNYLGEKGLKKVFGEIYTSGATRVEATILSHRKSVVMDTIKLAILAYREKVMAATGEYPKMSFYYGEVGGWPSEKFKELKFAGDIDFNFLSGDLDQAMELKKIFDEMIVSRYGRTAEELDIPCTVHGMATAEVYVGKHGQAFAESVTKLAWEIDFENASADMNLKDRPVPFREVLETMVLEAQVDAVSNSIDDLQTLKWPYQPGISLEMIRHFEHDIAGKNVFTDLESFIKALKYTDRSFTFLNKEMKGEIKFDPVLEKFAKDMTQWKKDPKKQVELIKQYYKDTGKNIPFEVNLEITTEGKSRATLEANDKFIKEFWDTCRQSMWDGANQALKKKTNDLKRRIKALGKDDLEASKAIYEDLVKLDEMLEIEDRILNDKVAGVHELDPDYKKNIDEFRKQRSKYKRKSVKYGHVKYIDPKIGKTYQWIETMLTMGKEFNIKMAGAALLSAPGKANDVLDFFDDKLMTKLRNGGGDEYIKILRKGQGLYWDEKANKLLKGTGLEGRFDDSFKSMQAEYNKKIDSIGQWLNTDFNNNLAAKGLKKMQAFNQNFNEGLSSSRAGRGISTGMMIYSLKDELPLYYNYIGERDFGGLATEFFKRRIPFGSAVERGVMGDYYGVVWEMTATLIPPVGIMSAAQSIGESFALGSIETAWSEELEKFIDNLYKNAKFKIVGVEAVGDNVKISEWKLLNVTYKSKKYDFDQLIALETADAEEMARCMQKTSAERPECFPMDKISNGLFEWFNAKDAFEHKFEKTDSWLQLIAQMSKNKYAGEKLMDHFRYQRYARLEQIKVEFLKRIQVKLEERRSGEQSLISGNFPKMYDELFQVADHLDIRSQLEERITDEFGGSIMQFMTSLKDLMRGAVRDLQGEADVWDIYEELSAFVTKNLRTYKRIVEGRAYAEEKLVLKKHDQGLRILTGPYFLKGIDTEDAVASKKWFVHVDQILDQMTKTLREIKLETEADPSQLDLSEGAYDLETLNRLVYHAAFKDMWKQVNSRLAETMIPSYLGNIHAKQGIPNTGAIMTDQDRALMRFSLHDERTKEIIVAFRQHYVLHSGQGEANEDEAADSALLGLSGLLKEIRSINNQIITVSEQIKGLTDRIESVEGHAKKQIKEIKGQLDAIASQDAVNFQNEAFDDSILNESADIDSLSKRIATLRTDIEQATLTACQQYEKIKTETKIQNLQSFWEVAQKASGEIAEKYAESTQIQHKLNPYKDTVQQTLAKMTALKSLVIDQSKLSEMNASLTTLKENVLSLANLAEGMNGHVLNGKSLRSRADAIIEKLKDYDPVLIAEKDKKIPGEIQSVYGQISATLERINSISSNIESEPTSFEEVIADLDTHLNSLQMAAKAQQTVTGRSIKESEDALKDIIALIDAAQIFYPPIEEANKNAKLCLDASKVLFDDKTSPEAQLTLADCSSFPGTKAQWDETEQTVRCNCPVGIDWDEVKQKCVDNSPSGQLARADCSPFPGTKAVWSKDEQAVLCNCMNGLDWDEKKQACLDNTPEGQIARFNCSQFPGTYAKWNAEEKRPKCYCPEEYVWNKRKNKCIDNSPAAQVARTHCKYPNSEPEWDASAGDVVCACIQDYEWNNAKTACRLKKSIQVANANCSGSPGTHPEWSEKHEDVRCYCDDGSWSSSKGRCVSKYEQDQARRKRQQEEDERQRRWEEQERRRAAEEEAERQQYCQEVLQKLNDASLGSDSESEWQQALNFSSAHNADCDSAEIRAAKQGRWRPSRSKYRPQGSSVSSPGESNDDIIIFTDDLPADSGDPCQGIFGQVGGADCY